MKKNPLLLWLSNLKSLHIRLIILLLLIILPLQLASIYISQQAKNETLKLVVETASANCSLLIDNLEREMRSIESQLNILLSRVEYSGSSTNNMIIKYYVESENYADFEKWIALRDIYDRLKSVAFQNEFIKDIIIYYMDIGITVSSENIVQDIDMVKYTRDFNAIIDQGGILTDSDDSLFISKLYPASAGSTKKPAVVVKAVLSESAFEDYMANFNSDGMSPTVFINHATETMLMDTETLRMVRNTESLSGGILKDEAMTSGFLDTGKLYGIVGEDKYYASSIYSEYLNCTIIQYIPIEDLFKTPNRFENFSVFLLVLSIPILIFAAITISSFYKQEIYTRDIELKRLQSQINPHFLFNSYFMLNHMINDEDIESASLLSAHLGTYFQYFARDNNAGVSLKSEYENANAYLHINLMRFENILNAEIGDLHEKFSSIKVPRLILQPLYENVVEHGMKNVDKKAFIRTRFLDDREYLHIYVDDNGDGLSDKTIDLLSKRLAGSEPVREITALFNIHRRLQLYFGSDCGVKISRSSLGGMSVELIIRKVIKK